MPFFSRLTDIVACNLTVLLDDSADKQATLREIVDEMQTGLAGANRSVETARRQEAELQSELATYEREHEDLLAQVKTQLAAGDEAAARQTLRRKKELADLVAGLRQQTESAAQIRAQLETTRKALSARLTEAMRRLEDLGGESVPGYGDGFSDAGLRSVVPPEVAGHADELERESADEIEAELAALKKELEG